MKRVPADQPLRLIAPIASILGSMVMTENTLCDAFLSSGGLIAVTTAVSKRLPKVPSSGVMPPQFENDAGEMVPLVTLLHDVVLKKPEKAGELIKNDVHKLLVDMPLIVTWSNCANYLRAVDSLMSLAASLSAVEPILPSLHKDGVFSSVVDFVSKNGDKAGSILLPSALANVLALISVYIRLCSSTELETLIKNPQLLSTAVGFLKRVPSSASPTATISFCILVDTLNARSGRLFAELVLAKQPIFATVLLDVACASTTVPDASAAAAQQLAVFSSDLRFANFLDSNSSVVSRLGSAISCLNASPELIVALLELCSSLAQHAPLRIAFQKAWEANVWEALDRIVGMSVDMPKMQNATMRFLASIE
jgi:hypothetical protein